MDLTTISYALTARSVVGTVGPFAAAVADRRGRRFGMLFGAGLFMVGAAVVVFWPSFPGFTISLVLATLGKYIFDPGMQAYIGDRVPYERRGRTIAFTEFGWSLAFVVGVPLMGFLIARKGWMAPFPLLALLGVFIVGGLFWMLPREDVPASMQALTRKFSPGADLPARPGRPGHRDACHAPPMNRSTWSLESGCRTHSVSRSLHWEPPPP